MCPKRSFDAILKTTELNKSRAYGSDSSRPTHHPSPHIAVMKDDFQLPGVIGYTGYKVAQPVAQKTSDRASDFLRHPPPGYTGFVPIAKSESLFGKSYSVIASTCARRVHGT